MRRSIQQMLSQTKTVNIVEENVLRFLGDVLPFSLLDEATLRQVVAQCELHFFPKDTVILARGGPPSPYLYVIVQGGVKKTLVGESGEETFVEVVGEGELFGVLSVLRKEQTYLDVIALEDTLCYAVPRQVVDRLISTHPAVAQYFLDFSIRHYIAPSLEGLERARYGLGEEGALPLTLPVSGLLREPVVTCRRGESIRTAVQRMNAHHVSSIVVVDDAGRAVGIITDWDLRERVIGQNATPDAPVETIMSAPVITVPPQASLYEALHLMTEHNIHHLVVAREGRPVGMVSPHDLLLAQGSSVLAVTRELARAHDVPSLKRVVAQADRLVSFLLSQGASARHVGWLVSDINDRLVARVVAAVEEELGPPPVPYCWLVTGSEGRREQTIKTDQDNALLYADSPPNAAESVRSYFLALGERVVARLVDIGFPPCPGRYTADNPQWVKSLSEWTESFGQWMREYNREELAKFLIFFDFRGVYGDLSLAAELRRRVQHLVSAHPQFIPRLALLSTAIAPPLGFLGQVVFEEGGDRQKHLNLKVRGTVPLVDMGRLIALAHGIEETNTFERLELAAEHGHLPSDLAREMVDALEFLMQVRIRHQWQQRRAGQPPSNHILLTDLSRLDRTLLREAFKIIRKAQNYIRKHYASTAAPRYPQ